MTILAAPEFFRNQTKKSNIKEVNNSKHSSYSFKYIIYLITKQLKGQTTTCGLVVLQLRASYQDLFGAHHLKIQKFLLHLYH